MKKLLIFAAIFGFWSLFCASAVDNSRVLRDDERFLLNQLPRIPLQATVGFDEEIEFKLETTWGERWSCRSSRPELVMISSEFDRKNNRIWQEFEIEGRARGECMIYFTHSSGKSFELQLVIR